MLALVTFGLVHDLLSADVFIYKNTSIYLVTFFKADIYESKNTNISQFM